jgi:hypothetical protein
MKIPYPNNSNASSVSLTDHVIKALSVRYYKVEQKSSPWEIISDTPGAAEYAIRKGGMFISTPALSEPYKDKYPDKEIMRYDDLVLDFDDKLNPEDARTHLRTLIGHLDETYTLNPYSVSFWCSGGKGFHARIPAKCLGSQAGDVYLPLIYKQMVVQWGVSLELPSIDTGIYCMKRGNMFRCENVKRDNGRYKVPITLDELQSLDIEALLELSENPREIEPVEEEEVDTVCEDLSTLYQVCKAAVHKEIAEQKNQPPVDLKIIGRLQGKVAPCINYILTCYPQTLKTSFNTLVMNLVKYFQNAGYELSDTLNIVEAFLQGYSHSTSYTTYSERLNHFREQWLYHKGRDGNHFNCSYIKGYGFSGSAFDCQKCQAKEPGETSAGQDAKIRGMSAFRLLPVGDLEVKPVSWLIRDFIETDTLALLFGDPGTYKSFLSIAFACCVASGKDFFGHKVKQGTVIFIAGEGMNGLARRFKAWGIRNQVNLKDMPLFVSGTPAGLSDPEQVQFVLDAVEGTVSEHGAPVLVVVDTVARNYGAGDENSTQDMTQFVAGCDAIRTQYGATVLLVHHCGLADKTRSRGSMALKGALDAEYRLDKDESGVIRFEATKMKDADYPQPTAFRPAVVELGIYDEDGVQSTSVVLDATSYEPPAVQGKAGRGKQQTVALEVLGELQKEAEQRLMSRDFDPDTARISVKEWGAACYKLGITDSHHWGRLKSTLMKNGQIEIEHGFVVIS